MPRRMRVNISIPAAAAEPDPRPTIKNFVAELMEALLRLIANLILRIFGRGTAPFQ